MEYKRGRVAAQILALSMILTLTCSLDTSVWARETEVTKAAISEDTVKEIEPALNYIYINEAELMPGDEQNIVVSWGDGTDEIQKIELTLENEEGEKTFLLFTERTENVFRFQEVFEKGFYHITEIKIENNDTEKRFSMEELEVQAGFSVGIENVEFEKSEHLSMESVTEEYIETQIVTFDESGTATVQDSIAEAMECSGVAEGSQARTKKEEVVVVLDPGHDSKHAGAQGNGVKEEVATFKIATYCKEELEKYEGVVVYLTREDASCPFPKSTSNVDDIAKRVKWAAEKDADVFVSIHLNASDSTSAKGAEVYYSKKSSDGKKLSQKIQNELVKVGLYDRKIKDNDAYRVINASQQQGFPGIIIEHAFITNASDANAYLKTEAGLKKLGVADASGIANYFDLKKIGTKCEIPEGIFTFTNKSTNKCLEIIEDAICLNAASKESAQQFEIVSAGDKTYYIRAVDSGKVLSIKSGAVCLEKQSTSQARQKWYFIENSSGCYYLRTKTGYYLNVETQKDGELCLVGSTATGKTLQWNLTDGDGHLTPQLISATQVKGSVTVKWKSVPDASGYYVYRKTNGEKWTRIATLKSKDTISYTDTSPIEGAVNCYMVRAYNGAILSGYDHSGVSLCVMEQPILAPVSYENGGMILQWQEVLGATKYCVYRKVNGGNWSKITVVNSGEALYYKDCSIKNGTLYYYTVRAFNGNNSSNYHSGQKAIRLSTPKLRSIQNNSDNVTIKWESVKGAEGYRVYRKEKNGKWKSIAKLTGSNSSSYGDKSASCGKTYVYTVRAYYGETQSGYDKTGLSITLPKETYLKYKTTAKVNYRVGPGTGYRTAGTLAKGTNVLVLKGYSKKKNGYTWYKVKINSKTYYVAAAYLKKR